MEARGATFALPAGTWPSPQAAEAVPAPVAARQNARSSDSAPTYAALSVAAAAGLCAGLAGFSQPRRPRRQVLHLIPLAAQKQKDQDSVYKDTVLLPTTDFSQRSNAKTREVEIQQFWQKEQVYEKLQAMPNSKGSFTLHDGPPYANGSLHMGHALNKILKDAINKFKAVQGHKVKYIPGWDCHGLPIELKVLQSLKSKERKDLTPLKLRQRAAQFARETVEEQRESFERYGVWGDFEEPYLTLLPKYEEAQLRIFEEMVRGGHIYRGRKPVYWSPSTRTALAEAELEYPEGHISQSLYAAFRCNGSLPSAFSSFEGLEVAVWTTTPWTIPANRAVAVNPALKYAVVRAEWPAEEARSPRHLVIASGLVEDLQELFGASLTVLSEFDGGQLEGLQYEHPITGITCPVVLGGSYITTESGTGLVHTAPGHGADDYIVGQKYGLEVAAPVNDAGNFTEEVGMESLVGANVLKDANDRVIEVLEERGIMLLRKPYSHKYPYDWRSKKPVITRATPQWFASIDGLRETALDAIGDVQFVPESGSNRMRPMIVSRSDWCISRQRSWGVPIPAFYHKETGEALLTPEVISHVRSIVAEKGTDAWFELPIEELLPEEHRADADSYERGRDTMDVWFDSGSSWAYVEQFVGGPVDLYLEGSDQHRGWFQSSLITSVAVNGRAPYKSVVTHGFVVDENGRKMSKSIGNVIDPRNIIEGGKNQKAQPALGADVLRFWAASLDFTGDVAIGQGILKISADKVTKLRNRFRFMLGNIHDFDVSDSVAYEDLPLLDKYIVHKADMVFSEMTQAYETYNFATALRQLELFSNNELSNIYLDLVKDRLYVSGQNSHARRSCQTVLRWLITSLARIISPVLCHLAEDVWQFLPGEKEEPSIFLSGWWKPFPGRPEVEAALSSIDKVLAMRDPVNGALEKARRQKMLGSGLEASVTLAVKKGSECHAALETVAAAPVQEADGLKCLLGVSEVVVLASDDVPALPEDSEEVICEESEDLGVVAMLKCVNKPKCERCWIRCDEVGENTAHPSLCRRCWEVVEALDVSSPTLETTA
eukprot:TRINITY_DN18359_c0_g2_i1.p1 TRINITY_DN18359_c0_g2~~TRINITY_DN18359_c0_g2_i1.p1  ORF type:complete len:1056 (+),score=244.62 TRINITY_DN18359_c0_g2_i1:50-3217(+)